jgi:hypothetical protein
VNEREFQWHCHPEAEAYVDEHLDQFVGAMPHAQALTRALHARTGTRLFDWIDHLVLAGGDTPRGQLADLGFEREEVAAPAGDAVYHHPGTIFPRILLRDDAGALPGTVVAAAIHVEEVSRFLMMHHVATPIEGTVLSPYRCATVWRQNGRRFLAVERRGYGGFVPVERPPEYPQRYLRAFERWATRPRRFDDEQAGMEQTLALVLSLVAEVGTDTAAWIAFSAERAYWQQRNRAGQVQKARLDSLGFGWGNHDHHTFRSSRRTFPLLIQIMETFGFHVRERFYAGAEAGWGAQVMDQPTCRFAVFADVDLSPEEVSGDFAHTPLPPVRQGGGDPRDELGTVGLWCALHGESMLGAGMHHLASRSEFDTLTDQLDTWGIEMMSPFSDLPHLRQAFTRGEWWDVAPGRLDRLLAGGQIDATQRARFARDGAIGSHLENIQRAEGFKGFNQQRVSDIIRRTDPRTGFGAA